jgi:hypothetical protein
VGVPVISQAADSVNPLGRGGLEEQEVIVPDTVGVIVVMETVEVKEYGLPE